MMLGCQWQTVGYLLNEDVSKFVLSNLSLFTYLILFDNNHTIDVI